MAERAIGTDISPPDLRAKITGRARYAEDFHAEGMAFAKLLLSPMPHARVRSVDTSRAEAMEGRARHPEGVGAAAAGAGHARRGAFGRAPSTRARPSWRWRQWTRPRPRRQSKRSGSTWSRFPSCSTRWTASAKTVRTRAPTATSPARTAPPLTSGPTASSKRPDRTGCPWASRLPSGRSATWRRRSPRPTWSSRRPSSTSRSRITPWSPAAAWRTGRTAGCSWHGSTQSTERTRGPVAAMAGIDVEDVVMIGEYCGGRLRQARSRACRSWRCPR